MPLHQAIPCRMYKEHSKKKSWSHKNVVYLLTSSEGKHYVGITTTTLRHRMDQHRHAIGWSWRWKEIPQLLSKTRL